MLVVGFALFQRARAGIGAGANRKFGGVMGMGSRSGVRRFAVLAIVLLSSLLVSGANGPTVTLSVDASDAPRKMFHAQLHIPAKPGTLTLYYPKWIPGEHGPTGPITDLTGLKFSASGKTLPWRRDLQDGFTFHVEVPAGESEVVADLDYASPASFEPGYSAGMSATEKLYIVNWNALLLYPAGYGSDQLSYRASLRLPTEWKFGTSLHVAEQVGSEIHFAPVSLTMLVDGPVLTGEYLKVVPLTPPGENPPAELDLAADSTAALDAPEEVFEHWRNLVKQAGLLFGARHYSDYHFLLTLSDHVAHFGLEHHESNDSRIDERSLIEENDRKLSAGLLPHEYVHSWNGKYRRPADLATPDYEQAMQTDLLWVYEGLTSYLGDMLSARSGERTPALARDALAQMAADLDHRSGRVWRNLQDTADGVPDMQNAPRGWEDYRRGLDYYDEDVLNWLWADVIIRQQSKGKKSLDDFCKLFYGAPSGPPMVKPYTFDDIAGALNQITPYDWRGFWAERLSNHGPGAPLGGVEGSGWKLVYDEFPSELDRAASSEKSIRAHYTVGLMAGSDGVVHDTVEGMMAAKAGIGPGMKIIAVNGRSFSTEAWHDAIHTAKSSPAPIELIVENTDYFRVVKLDYHGGEKYPHLVRDEAKPDLLTEIYRAK
jgi:predicted metalloprotease with PDZ domain